MRLFLPEKVDRCTEMIATYYRGDAAVDPALFDARKVAARGGVIAREEDDIIRESIQRARCSPAFDIHPYSPFWDTPHYLLSNLITEKLERALDSVKEMRAEWHRFLLPAAKLWVSVCAVLRSPGNAFECLFSGKRLF